MNEIVAAAVIGAPVFRMRAEVACRDLGSAPHRAVERLQDRDLDTQQIAALLGLRLEQVDALLAELNDSSQRVATLRVWVDPAHRAVLSTEEGLSLMPSARYKGVPLLELYQPSVSDISPERFTQAASTYGRNSRRIVVEEVLDLSPDIREAALQPNGRASSKSNGNRHRKEELLLLDHLLLLPDTYVVVRAGANGPAVAVHWGETIDYKLTKVARKLLLTENGLDPHSLTLTAAEHALQQLHATLGTDPDEAFPVSLDLTSVQDRILSTVGLAEEQLVIIAGIPKRIWPSWLREAHDDAAARGVECLTRDPATKGTSPRKLPGCGILIARDSTRALAHSDALPIGGAWSYRRLASQACLDIHATQAVKRLLLALNVAPPTHRSRPSVPPIEDVAAKELRKALDSQRAALPPGIPVAITDSDVAAFCEHADHEYTLPHDARKIQRLARGVAWERILHTACTTLVSRHAQLILDAFRLYSPGNSIDLDVVIRNIEHQSWWILDAKNATPNGKHIRLMDRQLKVARGESWIPPDFQAMGAIVYPDDLDPSPNTGEDQVIRTTLLRLETLLISEPSAR
jgi:hypothetical protein